MCRWSLPIFVSENSTTFICQAIHLLAKNYMFRVNNRSTRTGCEICSKLIIKIPEQRHLRRSGIFIVNFEHISHIALVFLLLTLMPAGYMLT